jgi:hypothetical protein
MEALRRAKGDRQAAYSQCVVLSFRRTGRLAPGFDNADLQAWYEQHLGSQSAQAEQGVLL